MECISRLREPDAGRISVLGLDPRRERERLHHLVGVQLQESELPEKLKVKEALDLYASFYLSPRESDELLESLGLAEKRDTRFGRLSGGQKQRLSIALALIGRPRIAVLDGLTTGLDPQARREAWALIAGLRADGVTIVLVTHCRGGGRATVRPRRADRCGARGGDRRPSALADGGGEQRISFRPSAAFDERMLLELTEVASADRRGDEIVVTGGGDVLGAVMSVLASQRIVAEHLRVEQPSPEDAFVALTGR